MTSSLEDRRAALNISRGDAANVSGLKVGEIWSLEHGKDTKDKSAAGRYERWLEQEEQKRDSGYVGQMCAAPPGGKVEPDWRSLKLGDRFRLKREPGVFTFQGLVTEAAGTQYVACYGGKPGYGMLRCIAMRRIAMPHDPLLSDEEDEAEGFVDDTEDREGAE